MLILLCIGWHLTRHHNKGQWKLKMPRSAILLRWLPAFALLLHVGLANATSNFLAVRLPNAVTVELPKNWTALSNNQRITIDSWVQAKRETAGASNPSSDLTFAANYYDEQGKTVAIFNIRYYPEQTVTQAESHVRPQQWTRKNLMMLFTTKWRQPNSSLGCGCFLGWAQRSKPLTELSLS